jgi:hypothetical protein
MKTLSISSIEKIENDAVYDIEVENEHHYILENGLISHNSGLAYAASTIVFLSKRKEKDGDEVVGNILHAKINKGRQTKENSQVDLLLRYDSGLNKYYGLLEIAEKHGIFKKVSTRYEMADGTKVFEKQINEEPEKYFTTEILELIDKAAAKEFKYASDTE